MIRFSNAAIVRFTVFALFFLMMKPNFGISKITLKPRFNTSLEYTDNIFLSGMYEKEDLIFLISPGFTAAIGNKSSGASLSYDIGKSYYHLYSTNNTLRHNAMVSAWWMASKHTEINLDASLLYTEDPIEQYQRDDPGGYGRNNNREIEGKAFSEFDEMTPLSGISDQEILQRDRNTYYKGKTKVSFLHWLNRQSFVNIGYEYEFLENRNLFIQDEYRQRPYIRYTFWPIPRKLGIDTFLSFYRINYNETIEDPASWEEKIESEASLIWWMLPRRLKWNTGLAHTIGVSDEENGAFTTEDDPDNWYETAAVFSRGTYWIYPKILWLDADFRYEQGVSYSQSDRSDPSDDYDDYSAALKISKSFSRLFDTYMEYQHAFVDFRGKGRYSDYTLYHPSVGIEYRPDQQIYVNLALGYLVREMKDGNTESAITFSGGLSKPWQINYRTFFDFQAKSGYEESFYGAQSLGFGFEYDMQANLKYLFSRYVQGEIYGNYERNRYTDNQQSGERIDLDTYRDNRIGEIGVGLVFLPGWKWRWLTMRIDYLYRDIDSTISDYSYKENRIRWQIFATPQKSYPID